MSLNFHMQMSYSHNNIVNHLNVQNIWLKQPLGRHRYKVHLKHPTEINI